MEDHQKRVVDEKADLDDKLEKLVSFTGTQFFSSIDADEQVRLKRQASIMAEYSYVLEERISAF